MEKVHRSSGQIDKIAREYWELRLADDPVMATLLGDRRFDDRLPDITPMGWSRMEKEYHAILERCESTKDGMGSGTEWLTRTALLVDARSLLDYLSCKLGEWTVDPLSGPQIEFMNLESLQPVRSPEEGRAMSTRWRAMAPYINDHIANLRRGASEGKVAVAAAVEKVIDEVNDLLEKPESDWALLRPLSVAREGWSDSDRSEFKNGLEAAVHDYVRPSFQTYLAFLKSELLPLSRPQERPGIVHLPGGSEAYSKLIRFHTSLDLAPSELHQTGLAEVARINKEMSELGGKVFGISDRKEILRRLRTDSSLYFTNRDEVADKAETALSKAKAAIEKWFGRLPIADCEVVRMGAHEEKHSTIAYYRQPATDGSRPGRYYINTYAPETRPRYEAEVLAYHESIPGHHLQIAIAQELEGIPEFRKNSGVTAFIEGWALYTERLSDEMGLYTSDLDRIGVLSYDSWRACRLVVDTGMHAMRWTRADAINFMMENTALAENNIVNEVDRYITWPGQALAYKTGQLEILRLRQLAREHLGGKFDIRKFHDAVLSSGAIPLEALRQIIEQHSNRP